MGTPRWGRRQPWGVALATFVVVLGALVAEPARASTSPLPESAVASAMAPLGGGGNNVGDVVAFTSTSGVAGRATFASSVSDLATMATGALTLLTPMLATASGPGTGASPANAGDALVIWNSGSTSSPVYSYVDATTESASNSGPSDAFVGFIITNAGGTVLHCTSSSTCGRTNAATDPVYGFPPLAFGTAGSQFGWRLAQSTTVSATIVTTGGTLGTRSYSLTISNPGTSGSVASASARIVTSAGTRTGTGTGSATGSLSATPLPVAKLVTAVTISGGTAVVLGGSTLGNLYASSAYVVDKVGTAWHLVDTLTNFGPTGAWAWSAALGEGTLAISWFRLSLAGVAIYEKSGPSFHLVADFRLPVKGIGEIGTVATDGSTVMVGAWGDGTGQALIYNRVGSAWRLSQSLTNPAPRPGDKFGWSVAISGTTALVDQEYGYGSVYTYREVGGSWILSGNLHAQGAGANFGANISLAGGLLAAGGFYGQGAYAFERSAGGWIQYPLDQYDPSAYSGFGAAVAAGTQGARTGNVPLVAIGAPGIPAANALEVPGRVYLYTLEPTSPPVSKMLTAPATARGDGFGEAVALSGDTLLIGQEALLPFGNQRLPVVPTTGRVYVYTDTRSGWVPSGQLPL